MSFVDWRTLWRARLGSLLPWDTFQKHQLGAMYATGDGVPKNDRRAARLYRRAAEKGDAESQYDLGLMYLWGEGVVLNPAEARRWLELAAAQGYEQAARVLSDPNAWKQ